MSTNKHTQVVDFSNPNADKIISGSTQAPMKNNKQSSVDYFWNQLPEILPFTVDTETAVKLWGAFEQAKAMQQEQTIDFAKKAVSMVLNEDIQNPVSINQLYNEIFNK